MLLLTDKSDAVRRRTETIAADAAIIPNVISAHTMDDQLRQ